MLGNGFFNIPRERYYKILTSYGAPKLIMKIQLEYTDGSTQHIVSDTDWKVTESPITFSSIYGGEEYDANKEQEGWKQPGFNDTDWNKAINSNWKTALISPTHSSVKSTRPNPNSPSPSNRKRRLGIRPRTELFRYPPTKGAGNRPASGQTVSGRVIKSGQQHQSKRIGSTVLFYLYP